MKVGIFSDCYMPQINGVVTSITILKNQLERMGHEVYIITTTNPLTEDQEDPNIIRLHSVPFLPLKNFRIAGVYSHRVFKKLKDIKLDIIHTQTEFGLGLFGMIIGRRLGIPVIHTYHTMYEDYCHYISINRLSSLNKRFVKKYSSYFSNMATRIIVPTEKVKNKLIEYGVIDTDIHIIPTGIDHNSLNVEVSEDEKNALIESLNIDKDDKILLFLGRIAKEKSIDVILQSIPEIIKRNSKIKLLIVGGGPEKNNLMKLTESLGISDNVIFTGEVPRNKVNLYYKTGDLFISCSTTETQGLTLFEAMSLGVPVVAKYDFNLDDFIRNEYNAIVYKEDNDLPDVILNALERDNRDIIINAFKTVEEFSAETFGCKIEELYEDVISIKEAIKNTAIMH